MNHPKRKWDILSDEERKQVERALTTYFLEQRDEELGIIAANELIDFFLREIGTKIEKKTMEKSKNWFKEKLQSIEIDFDLLTE